MELLHRHGITALVDARSEPYSRHSTRFNREVLRADPADAGIVYVFLGDLIAVSRPHVRRPSLHTPLPGTLTTLPTLTP